MTRLDTSIDACPLGINGAPNVGICVQCKHSDYLEKKPGGNTNRGIYVDCDALPLEPDDGGER